MEAFMQRLVIEIGKVRISVPTAAVPLFLVSATVCFVVWVMGAR